MDAFRKLTAVAVPLDIADVDADTIIPKKFLTTTTRAGLSEGLFAGLRYDENRRERATFVLNLAAYRGAEILVTGKNFGHGSSREHAPWAMTGFGFKCVIAPSFADTFYTNSIGNALLPVVLEEARVKELIRFLLRRPGATVTVDLEEQTVATEPDKQVDLFDIEKSLKDKLLHGIDDIGSTDMRSDKIRAFEERLKKSRGWE